MTLLAGQDVQADDLNPPAGKLYRSANQTIANDTTTNLLVDVSEYNYRSITDAANNRLVVPTGGAGLYKISLTVRWTNNATGSRIIRIVTDGTATATDSCQGVSNPIIGTTQTVTVDAVLAVGALITASVYQNSGAGLDVTTNFGGTFLSAYRIRA